ALVDRLAASYRLLGPLALPFEAAVASLSAADTQSVRAIVSIGTVAVGRAALERLPNAGLVACFGSGYEGVDIDAARALGIGVTHSPGANASSVADVAMGLVIACMRDFAAGRELIRSGRWLDSASARTPAAPGLTGRKLGIYGLGMIGRKIATRAEAFEMPVAYYNRRHVQEVPYHCHPTLVDLATWADVLVVAVRANDGNRHAVDRGVLQALGRNGFVINIARGPTIDEAALVDALQRGVIAGAGLDVFEHEPQVPAALLDLPNVAVTPHIGGYTLEAQAAMRDMVMANVDAFFAGRALPSPVPQSVFASGE
ncbi:MAG: 2-hydroxyacid dehydrogenase, partial [Casimicrobiaceae bacterium]